MAFVIEGTALTAAFAPELLAAGAGAGGLSLGAGTALSSGLGAGFGAGLGGYAGLGSLGLGGLEGLGVAGGGLDLMGMLGGAGSWLAANPTVGLMGLGALNSMMNQPGQPDYGQQSPYAPPPPGEPANTHGLAMEGLTDQQKAMMGGRTQVANALSKQQGLA